MNMYKVKRFSKKGLAKEIWSNTKRQAKENPITAAGFGLMAVNSANNIYNAENSKRIRKRTAEALENLSPKDKKKIIIAS